MKLMRMPKHPKRAAMPEIVMATLTFGPCGHVIVEMRPSTWVRLGDRYWCARCRRRRRLVTYSEQPANVRDAVTAEREDVP